MAPKSAAAQVEQCGEDHLEFETAVREHQGLVYSMAYHFLGNRAVAEELAQDVFLSLYRNFRNIKSGSHLVFWLRKVTSHRCLDYIRGQKHRAHLSLEDFRDPGNAGEFGQEPPAPVAGAPAREDEFETKGRTT